MSSLKIDEVDAKILETVQENGRISFRELAKKVGISAPTAQSRVERLMRIGVLEKFTAVVNPTKIKGGIMALLVIDVTPSNIGGVVTNLSKRGEVLSLYTTSGKRNVFAKIIVGDADELNEFVTSVLGGIKGILSVDVSIILKTIKEEYGIKVKPGYGIRLFCYYCGKEITGKPVKEKVKGKELAFCCNTCAAELLKSV